jgi:hypothetical protein
MLSEVSILVEIGIHEVLAYIEMLAAGEVKFLFSRLV